MRLSLEQFFKLGKMKQNDFPANDYRDYGGDFAF
jgi:hypothetical protein